MVTLARLTGVVTSAACAVMASSVASEASSTASISTVITSGSVRSEVTPLAKEALAITVPRLSPSFPPV